MTMWLKQSTAVTIKFGPFVDQTDGFTAEVALTLSQADFRLAKNGGDMAQKNESTSATHDELGYYDVMLDATDTNTLGRLRAMVHESGALPVWADFMVVPANVWDSLFGADQLQVHVNEMTADIITAAVIASGAIDAATFAAGAINAAAIASDAITDAKVASDVTIASVTGAVGSVTTGVTLANNAVSAAAVAADAVTELQSGLATGSSITTLQTSVDDLPTNAELATSQAAADDATLAAIAALNNLSAAQVNTEVDTALADYDPPTRAELTSDIASLATFIDTEVNAILADTDELQTDWANGGRLDLLVDAIKAVTDALPNGGALTALLADIAAILDDTGTAGVVVAAASKSGYALSSTGLDSISITAPSGVASNFREMMVQLWRRFFKKSTLTSTELKTYADNGSTVLTTQTASDDLTTQTLDSAS